MGSYTSNYDLYMPSVGETGWGQLVNQNFVILDSVSKTDSITTTFVTTGTTPFSINSYDQFVSATDAGFEFAFLYNTTATIPTGVIIKPDKSLRYMLFYIDGNFTMNGTIDTYPTTLTSEIPPNTTSTNVATIFKYGILCNSLTTLVSKTGNNVSMNVQEPYLGAYVDFNARRIERLSNAAASIPHAIAAGGAIGGYNISGNPGTSGTATNTCNGGGGGCAGQIGNNGGTGCIFGQYEANVGYGSGYGVSSFAKFRCAIIFIINGNLTISGSIIQTGGNGTLSSGGYGGGSTTGGGGSGGGGGAPVFIYYTGTYTNNGLINTNGGIGSIYEHNNIIGGSGGAGGIKVTKISL